MYLIKLCCYLMLVTLISGCNSTPNVDSTENKLMINSINYNFHGSQLYAVLEKTEEGYIFSNISERVGAAMLPWVRLNDMAPMFNTETESDCTLGLGVMMGKNRCNTENEALFRYEDQSGMQMAAQGAFALISYGLTGTGRTTNIVFNRELYNDAILVANSRNGKFIQLIADNMIQMDQHINTINDSESRKISNAQKKFKTTNISGFRVDEGFFDQNNVVIVKNQIFKPIYNFPEGEINKATVDYLIQEINSQKVKWESSFKSAVVKCPKYRVTVRHFNVSYECPDTVSLESEIPQIAGQFIIHSRNAEKPALPQIIKDKDKNISASLEEKSLTLLNTSGSFQNVDSISIYYRGKIFTKSNLNITLPPNAEKNIRVDDYFENLPTTNFENFTKNSLSGMMIDIGFAIKYSINGASATLYKNQKFNGNELVI